MSNVQVDPGPVLSVSDTQLRQIEQFLFDEAQVLTNGGCTSGLSSSPQMPTTSFLPPTAPRATRAETCS